MSITASEVQPKLVTSKSQIRELVTAARRDGKTIGVVPTMGALHDGHLSLVNAATRQTDFVVVTIFVNPTQFGPGEDLAAYPRTLKSDLAKLGPYRVDAVFAPRDDEMYPAGHSTVVLPPAVARSMEGEHRQSHFQGVTTVVLKLFNITAPDVAFFGQKDYQQALVIRRMVDDLDVPVKISVCPTIREVDGLAMSSRNTYLSEIERQTALSVSRGLRMACTSVVRGNRQAAELIALIGDELNRAGVPSIDYVRIVDGETLSEVPIVGDNSVALVAVRVGKTRLIDNVRLNGEGLSQLTQSVERSPDQ